MLAESSGKGRGEGKAGNAQSEDFRCEWPLARGFQRRPSISFARVRIQSDRKTIRTQACCGMRRRAALAACCSTAPIALVRRTSTSYPRKHFVLFQRARAAGEQWQAACSLIDGCAGVGAFLACARFIKFAAFCSQGNTTLGVFAKNFRFEKHPSGTRGGAGAAGPGMNWSSTAKCAASIQDLSLRMRSSRS